jgi:hypothetical protein
MREDANTLFEEKSLNNPMLSLIDPLLKDVRHPTSIAQRLAAVTKSDFLEKKLTKLTSLLNIKGEAPHTQGPLLQFAAVQITRMLITITI